MQIELREWNIKNTTQLMDICNHVDRSFLRNRLPDPYTKKDAKWWLSMVEKSDGVNGVYRAIVVDGVYAGNISIEQREDVYSKSAEIGYLLLKDFWSKGIMTQAVKKICELSFQKLDIVRITGEIFEPNIASKKVLERNGFVCEGKLKKAVFKNGNIYDEWIYGLVK